MLRPPLASLFVSAPPPFAPESRAVPSQCATHCGRRHVRSPLLEARDVSMRFRTGHAGAEVLALKHVSLRVDEREFVSLVGPSGAGKTTLLALFAGLEQPTAGTIL